MKPRSLLVLAALALVVLGCDGKDPERLNRVGKKIVDKSRKFADDANLPQVEIKRPRTEKEVVGPKKEQEPAAEIHGRSGE